MSKTKLKAVANKAEKAAVKDCPHWQTEQDDADGVYCAIEGAVFDAWRELTGRAVAQTDAEEEEQDQEFLDDPVVNEIMAPYTEKYIR